MERTTPTDRLAFPLAAIGLALETALMYGRSLRAGFVSDDWPLLLNASHGLGAAFGVGNIAGGYHYNPISELLVWGLYRLFGLHVVPYHILALALFWLGAILVLTLARRLTGRLGVGVLAAALFVGCGTQYEAAIWGVVAFWHTAVTIIYLAGLLCYIRAHDPALGRGPSARSYLGFLAALALGPFAHEQAVSLLAACALYRLLVLEHGRGLARADLARRLGGWVRDLAPALGVLACYLAFKLWLGAQTGAPQVPGAGSGHVSAEGFILVFATQATQAFVPVGMVFVGRGLLWLALVPFALTALALLALRGTPVQRFLVAWVALLVATMAVGLGAVASRHLYLITAPAALVWATVLADLPGRVVRRPGRAGVAGARRAALRLAPSVVLVATFLASGWAYAAARQAVWGDGAAVVGATLDQIGPLTAGAGPLSTLYLVDLPDCAVTGGGVLQYLFRNAPAASASLRYPGRFARIVPLRTNDLYRYAPDYAELASPALLGQLAETPGVVVLGFHGAGEGLVPWQNVAPLAPTPVAGAGPPAAHTC